MMALLFLAWTVVFALLARGQRRAAVVAGVLALIACLAMLRHHTTDALDLSL